jgi:hypothetical protein
VIEVKDRRVVNYLGDYGSYVASVTREIDDAELADGRSGKASGKSPAPPTGPRRAPDKGDRALRKEIATLERTIQRLDAEKRDRQAALLAATDPDEALRLHGDMTAVADKLAAAEERSTRRAQVGTGDRSEKIRTYNAKDNRVTDHRLGRNYSLEPVLAGQLEPLISASVAAEQSRLLEELAAQAAGV